MPQDAQCPLAVATNVVEIRYVTALLCMSLCLSLAIPSTALLGMTCHLEAEFMSHTSICQQGEPRMDKAGWWEFEYSKMASRMHFPLDY